MSRKPPASPTQPPPPPLISGRRTSIFAEVQSELNEAKALRKPSEAGGKPWGTKPPIRRHSSTDSLRGHPLAVLSPQQIRSRHLTLTKRRSTLTIYIIWLVDLVYWLWGRLVTFLLEPADIACGGRGKVGGKRHQSSGAVRRRKRAGMVDAKREAAWMACSSQYYYENNH